MKALVLVLAMIALSNGCGSLFDPDNNSNSTPSQGHTTSFQSENKNLLFSGTSDIEPVFTVNFARGSQILKTEEEVFDALIKNDKNYAVDTMRSLAAFLEKEFSPCGFNMVAKLDENQNYSWLFVGIKAKTGQSCPGTGYRLNQSPKPAPNQDLLKSAVFGTIPPGAPEASFSVKDYADYFYLSSFNQRLKNLFDKEASGIVLTKKHYLNLYDFAKNASEKEIWGFFSRIRMAKGLENLLDINGSQNRLLNSRGGCYQKLPHFMMEIHLIDK